MFFWYVDYKWNHNQNKHVAIRINSGLEIYFHFFKKNDDFSIVYKRTWWYLWKHQRGFNFGSYSTQLWIKLSWQKKGNFSIEIQPRIAMSKLQVLKYHKIMMTILGIYPRPHNASSRLRRLHSISPYFIIFCMFVANILSTTYVYQGFGTIRLSYLFESFAIVIGGFDALCAYLNMRWKMKEIGDVRLKLHEIADQGKFCHIQSIQNEFRYGFFSYFSCSIRYIGIVVSECWGKMSPIH